jgi:hypothetical protein
MVNFHENFVIATLKVQKFIKKFMNFLIYSALTVIFQKFKNQFLMTVHTLLGSFFPTFTLLSLAKKSKTLSPKKKSSKIHKECLNKYFGPKILTTNILDINVHKMYGCDKNQVPYCNVKSFKVYKT